MPGMLKQNKRTYTLSGGENYTLVSSYVCISYFESVSHRINVITLQCHFSC